MGDENVELVKGIYEKLYSECEMCITVESDISLISAGNKRVFNSAELQDHHALVPLAVPPGDITEEEENIYFLVVNRFFTVFKTPYIYNSVSVDVDVSGRLFKGNGIEIIQKGWKSSPGADEDEAEQEENYSGLVQGKEYPVTDIKIEDKKTEPKKHYTFATLLQLMENPREDGKLLAGLGTPATRGAILQKILDRKYVQLKGKNVLITDDGKFLVENVLKNDKLAAFISVPETTRWEEWLHDDTGAFIAGIKEFVRAAVSGTSMETYNREKTSLGKCPSCGGEIYEGKKNYYCSNYNTEKPCKFLIWKEISGASVSTSDVSVLLAGKQTKIKNCHSNKTGKEFRAAFVLAGERIEFRFNDKKN
jgi:DNA topoisomerase-3